MHVTGIIITIIIIALNVARSYALSSFHFTEYLFHHLLSTYLCMYAMYAMHRILHCIHRTCVCCSVSMSRLCSVRFLLLV